MNYEKIIHVENATMIREGQVILQSVNWEVMPKEHWAILGANGSGKTSLLKIITGYEWPTTGKVRVLGETFGEVNLHELRKRIGWVTSSLGHQCKPEDSAGAIALSGYDASIGLWREDFTDEEFRHAAETLRRVGADSIADRPWGVLSQGERQRTLIARALINRPLVLILDEPCAGLDPWSRELLLNDLEVLASTENAPTILFVTHHFEELRPYLTNTLAIKDGRILHQGKTEAVLSSDKLEDLFTKPMIIKNTDQRYSIEWK
ncbi:MAG: ABC transporter ATP-binding protein [Sumerlaeia bacterium]